MLAAPDFHDFTLFALRQPVLLTSTDDEGSSLRHMATMKRHGSIALSADWT
jgi:hypothetical protein